MNLPEESYLLRLVVDSFELPETSFMVMIKSPPSAVPRAQNLLLEAQFAPAVGVTTQLDTFNEDHSKTFGRARSYAGLVLAKPASGPLHDSLELVLAYIAIAAAYCPRTGPMQPLADSQPIYSSLN